MTASRAVMDGASRERENLLYNFYRMGKNSIEGGNRDSWTTTFHRVTAAQAALGAGGEGAPDAGFNTTGGGRGGGAVAQVKPRFRNPPERGPVGFLPPDAQPAFR